MSANYDKPFKTFEELVSLMQSRGITVDAESRTLEILSSISYYSLINGYKNTFLQSPNDDIFIEGTTFEMIYQIYLLDSAIASVLLKYILIVERSLKTKIAYRISQKYGVHHSQYLDPSHYSYFPKGASAKLLNHIQKKCIDPFPNTTSHYYSKNKNHVPPWIVVNDITFNRAIEWYKVMTGNDKSYICRNIIPYSDSIISISYKKEFLLKALELLRDYRNSIAHGNKVFSPHIRIILPKSPLFQIIKDSSILSTEEYDAGLGQKDLYAVLISLPLLINNIDLLLSFFLDMSNVLNEYTDKMILNKTYSNLLG